MSTHSAYVREVQADHIELDHMVRSIRAALESGGQAKWMPPATEAIAELLERTSQHLERHFAHEEAGGYMEEALALAPRFGPQASQLLKQHAWLNQAMSQLASVARQNTHSPDAWPQIAKQTVDLLKKLLAHESGENHIFQEAFNVDLELTE
jgi:hypothetical protein